MLKKVDVESVRYVESDTALINRVLGREVGGKQNILVMNDEAHHAYRIRREEPDEDEEELFGEDEDAEEFFKEATVWVDGLDRIHKLRGINFCVDLSATPYFLGRVGQDTNRPFPWVVSDFGLIDAIESGLVKIPQLAVRDTTGAEIPATSTSGTGFCRSSRRPSAAASGRIPSPRRSSSTPITRSPCWVGCGRRTWRSGEQSHGRPAPAGVHPRLQEHGHRQGDLRVAGGGQAADGHSAREDRRLPQHATGSNNTIRVDSKVVQETDTGGDQERREPLDAPHAGHGRQDRVAEGPAGPDRLSRGFRGTGEEAGPAAASRRAATCAASSASAC